MPFDDLVRPPLDPVALSAALTREGSTWREVRIVTEAPSTNTLVAEAARRGEDEGLVVVAEHQTSGRGRLGRTWTTPPSAALTVSFLLRPVGLPSSRWSWLPLLTGIAVAEAVHRVCHVACALKWPNDVMVGERKLAGILVERADSGTPPAPAAVVGVGINVSATRSELAVPTATSLRLENAATLDRSVVLREVLRTFAALYGAWSSQAAGSAGLHASYVRRCATLGRRVRVDLPSGEQLVGVATAVDEDGRLLVDGTAGARVLAAGDVVHVRPDT